MTIDKIKHYMNPEAFSHWSTCKDAEAIRKARNLLAAEINAGLLQGIAYTAELNLLDMLLK